MSEYDTLEQHDPMPLTEVLEKVREGCSMHMNQLDNDGHFVTLANEFARDNWLMYFAEGFPAEWIEQEIIDGEKNWNHFIVKPDDKNIDKICKIYHNYGQLMVRAEHFGQTEKMKRSHWEQARESIKSIMEKKKHDAFL